MPEEPENKPEVRRPNDEIIAAKAFKGVLLCLGLGLFCFVLGLFLMPPVGQPSEKGYYADCYSKLIQLEKKIYWLMKVDKETEKPENWSVCDLIRNDLSQYDGENRRMEELNLSCPKDHQTYLIFPVSAYIGLYEESVQPPVPVAMCRPNVHHMIHAGWCGWFKKFGVLVLYSDGTVKSLTTKEAEKLVAEQHPVPLELKSPEDERESEQGDEEAQIELNRLGTE